jgi:TRAP-type C4-dicarboxylate transport system permease small subunit
MATLLGRVAAVWAILGGVALIAIIAVTTTNVGAFALDRVAGAYGGSVGGLPGYEDFVQLAVSCAALMFFPWCQHRRGHVAVELFVSRLPAAARRWLDRVWCALIAALCAFLALMMARGMLESRADGTLTPVLGWPEWPFFAPGVASLILWGLIAAAQAADPRESEGAIHG